MDDLVREILAKALFEARPHRHPARRIPNWDIQPEDIKNVFRVEADPLLRWLRSVDTYILT
jgi:hypothetical protein